VLISEDVMAEDRRSVRRRAFRGAMVGFVV
jgi:hypothetical protein